MLIGLQFNWILELIYIYLQDLKNLTHVLLNDHSLQKTAFHRSQNLTFKNGFPRLRTPPVGIGQDPLLSEQVIQQEINKRTFKTPDMTHGSSYKSPLKQFEPAYVTLDKKVWYNFEDLE